MVSLAEHWQGLCDRPESLAEWRRYALEADKKTGCFLQFDPLLARDRSAASGSLAGVPFAVKDNIAVEPFRLTCASRFLANLVSPYTATAVRRLQAQGAVVVGKTNLDEFGMGSSTENSAYQKTLNPWNLTRVPGGSSGGSAAAVAAGIVPFALGSDTGGSVRQPAAFCGVYGLKPTYGAVSRYGLVAYASSLEVIGVISKTVAAAGEVFRLMRGQDELDHSSLEYRPAQDPPKKLCVGLPVECLRAVGEPGTQGIPLHPDVQATLEKTAQTLKELGFTLREVSLPSLEYVVSAYFVIACAEASANLARFDGIRYGARAQGADNQEQLVISSRSRGFGDEVKLRILLGTYVLRSGFQDQYYLRAQRIRTAIRRDFERAFSEVQLILMPVYPTPAFKLGGVELDPFAQKLADQFTCSANLAGLPALSFPAAVKNGLPIGLQFLAPPFAEDRLLRACSAFEEVSPSPNPPLYGPWS